MLIFYSVITFYKKEQNELVSVDNRDSSCWINISTPFNQEHLKSLSEQLNIPLDYLIDSLDIDERSRFEKEDGVKLIVIKVPILNPVKNESDAPYLTIPIGIVIVKETIITITSFENPVLECFLKNKIKNFNPADKELFVLQLFDRSVHYFLQYLKEINNERNIFEKELYNSSRNEELAKLLNIQKSLVYFVTSLRANELLMLKMQRTDFLKINQDEEKSEMLQDIIVDSSQALEMANVYTNILTSTMDAFASIISNNLNVVMRRLTSVTIILMLPTLVASLYGMNVKIPLEDSPYAFYIIMAFSVFISFVLGFFFMKKKWF